MENGLRDGKSIELSSFVDKRVMACNKTPRMASSVPWIDRWEFRCVGEALLSAAYLTPSTPRHMFDQPENALSLEEALRRVDDWKMNSSQPLPASVEATGSIALAIWREAESGKRGVPPLQSEIRMIYATAIIRTINGLADPFQQNRTFASSIAQICLQIGVPLWLVDIRHEATHNQLPSLSVLRTAAVTLLKYLRSAYWDPPDTNKEEAETALNVDTSVRGDLFDFGEESPDDIVKSNRLNEQSRLGTNKNMFSALADEKKKSKRKDRDAAKEEEEKAKKKALRPPSYFVQRLTCLSIPLDVSWNALLEYLLLDSELQQKKNRLGRLVPDSTTEFPVTYKSIVKLRQQFKCLLSGLGKKWPGFIVSLLIALIDQIITIEGRSASAPQHRTVHFLESWVQYLISNEFFAACGFSTQSLNEDGEESPAPFRLLQSYNYPLNGICDRLESACSLGKASMHPSTQKLKNLFLGILGDQRMRDFGLATARDIHQSGESTISLTLDEMEQFLSDHDLPKSDITISGAVDKNEEKNQPNWRKCRCWDPCSIGSFPGHPM